MSFVHLHVHSEYSLLDGFSNIKKLVSRAKELNMPAVGLTDHGTMFGVIDFYNNAVEHGVKPIVGVESYLAPRRMSEKDPQLDKKATHLLLLAENMVGYQNLLKIASEAQLNGFYYNPRIDHELLAAHSEGLICTSGCMSAEIPRLIQNGNIEKAQKQLDWYYEVFGQDRFYLELQQHNIKELDQINKILLDLGRRYEAKFVATNDVHYVNPEDARLQDIMLAIQTGCLLSDPNRMRMTDASYYFRTPEEMTRLFIDIPEAITNTLIIADRCNVDLSFKGYHLPKFEVPEGYTPQSYLVYLCEKGLAIKYESRMNDPLVRQRLDYELKIIHSMGFDTYFLIVWDLCRYAESKDIWYNARGSAAGSIVAYSLDITLVDPLEHGLIFERFLNPGRISMPDIDLDFRDDRRAEMLEYTAKKYGDDKVAQIITFGTLGARAAIRDVGRVMDIPLSEVDKVAKMVPNIPGKPVTILDALNEVKEFKEAYQSASYIKELIDTASQMEGVVRNAGTHAAGVIITDKPTIEYIPLHRPTGSSQAESPIKTVTQFEMSKLEELGLLKVDFLGLATLTIMAKACDLIKERHGKDLNLHNIPTDDPETYELLGRGETAGVFQVEGSGMRRWLMQMKPRELANVIAMVALFRPGPMEFIPQYIARMHGEEKVEFLHPSLEPIFKETYGFPVYQEQLMFAAMNLAGYTAPESDDLRKAISKKMKDKLLKHREKFVQGALTNGIQEDVGGAIFDEWEEFARYGFNKSHAVDYGVIAVQTAYLKLHYSLEYMTALLSVSKNDNAKIALYVADSRRMGVPVEPPDINVSEWDFSIEDHPGSSSVIRFGLGAVKNVGQGPVDAILKTRGKEPFENLTDFSKRVDLRQVGKRALESLVKVGALDRFGSRMSILESIDRLISVSTSHFRAVEMGQMSLFSISSSINEEIILSESSIEVNRREILNWERELIGLYVSDHPLSPVAEMLTKVITHFAGQLAEAGPSERVRVAGIITKIRHHQSKAGKPMGFVTIEDLQGTIDLVIFPRVWERVQEIVTYDKIVLVDGRVDLEGAEPKVLVDNLTTEFSFVTSQDSDSPKYPGWNQQSIKDLHLENQNAFIEIPSQENHKTNYIAEGRSEKPDKGYSQGKKRDISDWDESIPPPPDLFPPDWEFIDLSNDISKPKGNIDNQNIRINEMAVQSEPKKNGNEKLGDVGIPKESSTTHVDKELLNPLEEENNKIMNSNLPLPIINLPGLLPPYYLPPSSVDELEKKNEVRMLTVIFRSTGDKTRDVLRLRRIHGIISSYPGNDRFAFHVFERGRGYLLEFPNYTAGICNEMLARIRPLLGSDDLRVENITFQ